LKQSLPLKRRSKRSLKPNGLWILPRRRGDSQSARSANFKRSNYGNNHKKTIMEAKQALTISDAIVGPKRRVTLPAGVKELRSPTDMVWII
jgi:hypothetical protein